mmetsp:Transcript_20458/g.22975  ORF Transcript_20458/g.22975 Transcript_20458/m.22975 type:complete len:87 (+) Transcript_20458:981-1241(+)
MEGMIQNIIITDSKTIVTDITDIHTYIHAYTKPNSNHKIIIEKNKQEHKIYIPNQNIYHSICDIKTHERKQKEKKNKSLKKMETEI